MRGCKRFTVAFALAAGARAIRVCWGFLLLNLWADNFVSVNAEMNHLRLTMGAEPRHNLTLAMREGRKASLRPRVCICFQ